MTASERQGAKLTPTVTRDVMVPMRDGTRLCADIYRPSAVGPHPVLLMRVPYSKDHAQTVAFAHPYWYAHRGYIVVVQDTRGRHKSEGFFEPWVNEAEDGYDTIEWAGELADSSGKVGTYGFSYAGASQLQAAAMHPPHLRAITPAFTSLDFYGDWIYPGGALSWAFLASWAVVSVATESARRLGRADLEERLHESQRRLTDSYRFLPISEYPYLPEDVAGFFHQWLQHPVKDAFWSAQSSEDAIGQVNVPALHIGGWSDAFIEGTLTAFTKLARLGESEQRMVIGPWMHMPWTPWIASGDPDRADLSIDALQLQWFDRWLKADVDNSGRPNSPDSVPVRVYVMGRESWTNLASWPPPSAERRWYLHSAGRANSRLGDGELRADPPNDEDFDAFVYDPRNPVPSLGGRSCCDAELTPIGVRDQSSIELRNDVLVYTSMLLDKALKIAGSVRLRLWVATSAVDTDFTAKLVDVHPDGRALNVVDGIVRGRHQDLIGPEVLLQPARIYEFQIELGSTSWQFLAGHRLRLEVASSNFPRFNRSGNSPVHPNRVRFSDLTPALQQVFHDHLHPSVLELPVALTDM